MQDRGNSSVLALELPRSRAKQIKDCHNGEIKYNDDGEDAQMMTSSNGFFPRFQWLLALCEWNPLTKASDAELWWFLWSAPEQTIEQTIETPVIRYVIALIMTSLLCFE